MRPVCLLDRTKNLYQSDRLHFISDSLYLRSFFAPRADGDEEGGGVGGDGDGTEEADAADEGADDLGGNHVEVEDMAEREIGLRGDEEDERERTALFAPPLTPLVSPSPDAQRAQAKA